MQLKISAGHLIPISPGFQLVSFGNTSVGTQVQINLSGWDTTTNNTYSFVFVSYNASAFSTSTPGIAIPQQLPDATDPKTGAIYQPWSFAFIASQVPPTITVNVNVWNSSPPE